MRRGTTKEVYWQPSSPQLDLSHCYTSHTVLSRSSGCGNTGANVACNWVKGETSSPSISPLHLCAVPQDVDGRGQSNWTC